VAEFTRQVFEEVRKVKSKMEFSAAVFKNPVQSGRFIGQDWRRFAPWVHYAMPMDYRSHFGGDFETHLDLLAEAIQQQKAWARDFPHFWPGVAAYQLYDEEREPLTTMRRLLRDGGKDLDGVRAALEKVAPRLRTYAPELHGALEAFLKDPKSPEAAAGQLEAFLANVPEGYYPPEKLTACSSGCGRRAWKGPSSSRAGGSPALGSGRPSRSSSASRSVRGAQIDDGVGAHRPEGELGRAVARHVVLDG